jgi:hypothetical protein
MLESVYQLLNRGVIVTIQTILGYCERCGSRTHIHVIMDRNNGSEEIARCYCGECLGKKGFIPKSLFIDINAMEEGFRPGFSG